MGNTYSGCDAIPNRSCQSLPQPESFVREGDRVARVARWIPKPLQTGSKPSSPRDARAGCSSDFPENKALPRTSATPRRTHEGDPQSNALPNCATTRKEGWKCSNPPKALQPRGGANSLRVMRAFALRIDARLKTRQPRTVGCVVAEEVSRLSCLRPSLTAKVAAVRAR